MHSREMLNNVKISFDAALRWNIKLCTHSAILIAYDILVKAIAPTVRSYYPTLDSNVHISLPCVCSKCTLGSRIKWISLWKFSFCRDPSKPPSRAGACRVCLKSFKPDDFSKTCKECQQRVCEDCASYSKLDDNEDPVREFRFF